MLGLTASAASNGLAVVLAAVAAVLFGLASVRQHGAVQATMTAGSAGVRQHVRVLRSLVRQPSWLVGTVQGLVAGGLHVVALALASISLVQPVGVIAVPVTVVAAAARDRRRPARRQLLGSLLSVGGIAVLTVLLLSRTASVLVLPSWVVVAVVVAVTVAVTLAATLSSAKGPPLLRCVILAAAAAILFGLNSVLLRTIGHIVSTSAASAELPLLVTAVVGLAVALPVGLWAMQTAYVSGAPHVVICVLTLIDPLTAVAGGRLLLQDGVQVSVARLVGVAGCALVAAVGVVLLSADYPAETGESAAPDAVPAPTPAG